MLPCPHQWNAFLGATVCSHGFCVTFFQTIGNVLLSYADIIAKDFPNHVKKEKVVNVPERINAERASS